MLSFLRKSPDRSLPADAYGFSFAAPGSAPLSLESFRGKALLIVNTASACGFTPQYEGLEQLHRRYQDRGFSVLGVPCNDFGAQEPGSDEEIGEFCVTRFAVSFPMTPKKKSPARVPTRFIAGRRRRKKAA